MDRRGDYTVKRNLTVDKEIHLIDDDASNYFGLKAPALTADKTFTLPTGYPVATGYVLSSTDAGVMSWSNPAAFVAGATTQIQFNDGGVFGADDVFLYDKTNVRMGVGFDNKTKFGAYKYNAYIDGIVGLGAAIFTNPYGGGGLNDATSGGAFTGSSDKSFTVEIIGGVVTGNTIKIGNDVTYPVDDTTDFSPIASMHVTGMSDANNNGDFRIKSVGIGSLTITNAAGSAGDSGGAYVKIKNAVGPDLTNYYRAYGDYAANNVEITGVHVIGDGITITFGAVSGHTGGTFWEVDVVAEHAYYAKNASATLIFDVKNSGAGYFLGLLTVDGGLDINAASTFDGSFTQDAGAVAFNEAGADYDFHIEGDTATNLFYVDAGLGAVQIGTTTVGAIADFRPASIVFNDASGDIDFIVESDSYANMFVVDAGSNSVQIGTGTLGSIATFSNTGIVFNDESINGRDFTVESDANATMLCVDGSADGVGVGTNAVAAGVTLDVNGSLAWRVGSMSLSNGSNNNVNIAENTFLKITGPTAVFTITGMANGADGRIVFVYNPTANNMTIANESGSSSAANRILTLTGGDVTTTGTGCATFIYDSAASRWISIRFD